MANSTGVGELGRDECDAPEEHPAATPPDDAALAAPVRRDDWLERLWRVLQEAKAEPFAFGAHDCAHLVAAALDAMTGSDWQTRLRDIYRDERGAVRIMRTPGELERLVSEALGRRPVPRNLARRGDIVALHFETGPAIGICVGERVAVASDGILYVPLERAHCAWRIE